MRKNNIILDSASLQEAIGELNQLLSDHSDFWRDDLWIDDERRDWVTEDASMETDEALRRATQARESLRIRIESLEKAKEQAMELRDAIPELPDFNVKEAQQLVENLQENLKTEMEIQLKSVEDNFESVKERLTVNFKFDLGKELLQIGSSIGIQEAVKRLELKFQNACAKEIEGCREEIKEQFDLAIKSCEYRLLPVAEPPDGHRYIKALDIAEAYLSNSEEVVNSQLQDMSKLQDQLSQHESNIKRAVELFQKDEDYRKALEKREVQISQKDGDEAEKLLNLFGKNGQTAYARLGFNDRQVEPDTAENRAWEWLEVWEPLRSVDIYTHAVLRLGQLIEILEEPDNND